MNKLTGLQHKTASRRGFTLAETLLVILIIVILAALLVPNLVKRQKELRQKELDAKAEIIFIAAQNELTKLRASGNADLYGVTHAHNYAPTQELPWDYDEDEDDQYCFMTSNDLKSSLISGTAQSIDAAHAVMKQGVVDDQLLNGNWVIEYDRINGRVCAVFYSDTKEVADEYEGGLWDKYNDEYRFLSMTLNGKKVGRMESGAKIGYYSGEADSVTGDTAKLKKCTITVHNAEKLEVELTCETLRSNDRVQFKLYVGKEGEFKRNAILVYSDEGNTVAQGGGKGGSRSYTYTLDDLSDKDLRFVKRDGGRYKDLAGVPLKLWAEAKLLDSTNTEYGGSVEIVYPNDGLKTNGLFADDSTATEAHIACGRHLQNLDTSSGVPASVTAAVQVEDVKNSLNGNIDFNGTKWQDAYGKKTSGASYFNGYRANAAGEQNPLFLPITNNNLKSYNGNGKIIAGLNVGGKDKNGESGGDIQYSGLFTSLSGGETEDTPVRLSNITLTGVTAGPNDNTAKGAYVGALVSGVNAGSGYCEIDGCKVYLTSQDHNGLGARDEWIGSYYSTSVGGLVGQLNSGSLKIVNSSASSVLRANSTGGKAGGLVGEVYSGFLTIQNSYADSYFYGSQLGGLVGAGTVKEISNCYASGFLTTSGTSAGLVNGTIQALSNSYTVCDLGKQPNGTWAVARSFAGDNNYFRSPGVEAPTADADAAHEIGSTSLSTLAGWLGSAFASEPVESYPYNLNDNGLTTQYIYPGLKTLTHYGDWPGVFQPGSLVYYEYYPDDSYGFFGASVESTLKNYMSPKGDGYGIVVTAASSGTATVEVYAVYSDTNTTRKIESETRTITLSAGDAHAVTGTDGIQYYLYCFPAELSNLAPQGTSFWQKVRITTKLGNFNIEPKTFFYNQHFAIPVRQQETVPAEPILGTEAEQWVTVATPRQLYALSQYYDSYWSGKVLGFQQNRDLNYSYYDWDHFYTHTVTGVDGKPKVISYANSQPPIGQPFSGAYNGNNYTITGVSIVSQNAKNVGLFGTTLGSISNVVLSAPYYPEPGKDETNYFVKRVKSPSANEIVNMGVLVGYNQGGLVSNCAVAGYTLSGSDSGEIFTYSNSELHLGCLVGTNEGTIQNCSAVVPEIDLTALQSVITVGGFAGRNTGVISDCYGITFINADTPQSTASVAGFSGANSGRIISSYCCAAMITSESANSYGFTPRGGQVSSDCYYLNDGTYYFIKTLRAFGGDAVYNDGSPIIYDDLTKQKGADFVRSGNSLVHNCTDDDDYPFRCVVSNSRGKAHYGDWMITPELGEMGVFYWEKEINGSNNGYHFSFLGVLHGEGDTISETGGSTLCTAHDDGGEIAEFGYGYYMLDKAGASITLKSYNYIEQHSDFTAASGAVKEAKDALETQMPGYIFYPYITRYATSGDYLYLNTADGKQPNGEWTLSYTPGAGKTPTDYTYYISPFFADAMSRLGGGSPAKSVKDRSVVPGTPANADTDSSGNSYDVRSVQQFRYINWNYATHNCDTLVYAVRTGSNENIAGVPDSGTYQQFPYLQYATVLNKNDIQTGAAAEALHAAGSWRQSHDLHGTDGEYITPIAGMATSTPVASGKYANILFAWFGGKYDGQSYKIQNINVKSPSFTVGLFGSVAGSTIENVILYSDADNRIERYTEDQQMTFRTTGSSTKTVKFGGAGTDNGTGAYSLGGLIGMAYVYSGESDGTIRNCAIAGYHIVDSSTNQQGAGTANVGGLVGLANINLENCSSVVDILIRSKHDNGHNVYGSYVRIGGLAGSAGISGSVVRVQNCYTGGSIRISSGPTAEDPTAPDTLHEIPTKSQWKNNFAVRNSGGKGYSLNIFVSGMIGGSYAPNISNFTMQVENQPDGTATVTNCYTYMQLPNLEGTVRAVSLFANQGDRYNRDTKITLTKCFYLNSVMDAIEYPKRDDTTTWPEYFFDITQCGTAKAGDWTINKENYFTREGVVKPTVAPTADQWALLHESNQMANLDSALGLTENELKAYSLLVISEDEARAMLQEGNLNHLIKYLSYQKPNKPANQVGMNGTAESRDYEQLTAGSQTQSGGMATELGASWGWVPTTEGANDISGKYSFSSDPSQNGKNYPFPAVVTQDGVYVHYGAWPNNGAYWAEGRTEMDVFENRLDDTEAAASLSAVPVTFTQRVALADVHTSADDITVTVGKSGTTVSKQLTTDGKYVDVTVEAHDADTVTVTENDKVISSFFTTPAEKKFTLKLKNNYDGGFTRLSADDGTYTFGEAGGTADLVFTVTPKDIAEVIKVEGSGKELQVTLRALKPGSVTLAETEATKALTEPDGVSCNVTITTKMEVSSSPSLIVLSDDLSAYTITCDALAGDVSFKELGEWSYSVGDNDGIEVEQLDSAAPYKYTVSRSDNPGDCSLTVRYTYYYLGNDLPSTVIVPVRTLGYIGLSRGGDNYQAWTRRAEPAEYTLESTGAKPTAPQGADVFLFAPASEGELVRFGIQTVAVKAASDAAPVSLTNRGDGVWTDDNGTYQVSFFQYYGNPDIEVSNGFELYGASVRLKSGDAASKDVEVTVTVTDPSVEKAGGAKQTYTMKVSGVKAYRWELSFDPVESDCTGVMRPIGLQEGANYLPSVGYDRRGYMVASWNEDPNGAGQSYYTTGPDAVLNLSSGQLGDRTLYAQWVAHAFTVRLVLDVNEDPKECIFYYNDTRLPDPTAEAPASGQEDTRPTYQIIGEDEPQVISYSKPGKIFKGWDLGFGGNVEHYDAGDTIKTDKDVITLYAQWETIIHPALELYYTTGPDTILCRIEPVEKGSYSLEPDYTGAMTQLNSLNTNGWELEGWYAVSEDGSTETKVLNTDGEIVAAVNGYTTGAPGSYSFDITGTVKLYAKWTKSAYVPVKELTTAGTYLIGASLGDNGEVLFMKTSGGSLSTVEDDMKLTSTVGTCYADGNAWPAYVAADQVGNDLTFQWEAKAVSIFKDGDNWKATVDGEDDDLPVKETKSILYKGQNSVTYFGVSLKNMSPTCKKYLRNENTGLTLQTRAIWNNSGTPYYSDRFTWMTRSVTNGDGETVTLVQSAFKAVEQTNNGNDTQNDSIGWSGSAWTTGSFMTSYFYKLQPIYSFRPF